MATLEFRVDDAVQMALGARYHDTTNGISFLIREAVGDAFTGGRWGGPTRKMEVYLSVPDDMAGEYRDRLQAALDAGTVTPSGTAKPTVVIQVKQANSPVRPSCCCDDD